MKKPQSVLLLVALVVAMFTNAGCVPEKSDDAATGKVVEYSSVGDSNEWFVAFARELETEAEKRGYKLRVRHAQAKIEKQIADVEDIVSGQPDYLILGPIDTKGSARALNIAKDADVPVIVVNRDIVGKAGEDFVTKIYSDFEWIGEKMAEEIHGAFPADAKQIRVVELHGTAGGGNTIGMQSGFRKKMAEYPNMKIVASQLGDFRTDVAMTAMENIITSGVEFDAVVCHFDTEAMGAMLALKAAKRKTGSDPSKGEIIIVGNGGTKDGLKAVKAGEYHKIVSVTPYYANQVFDAIEAHASGKKLESYIRVDDIVIDKNNVDEHMDSGF
ncbi:MAG: substrate-binding domain-containing protein [Phycisphaerales bacterium]|jgi:galactofuranose transport system substrate-binding protein|nr:substrate-binding domain-containing protein [Phycisphaerales bacterium]